MRTSYEVINTAKKASTDDEKCRSAMDLVVVHRTENAVALSTLKGFYTDGSEMVRRAVVAALAYRKWPGGLAFLDEIAESDPDELLRERARETARAWRENRDRWEDDPS